jgi:hypothetical protein
MYGEDALGFCCVHATRIVVLVVVVVAKEKKQFGVV